MKTQLLGLMFVPLIWALPVTAEIYKWVDAEGTVHYSDKPVANAKPADLPTLQGLDEQKVTQPVVSPTSKAKTDVNSGPDVAIIRPLPEETFRDGRGLVSAQAAISPALAPDQALVYYLDGSATAVSPTKQTSIQLQGIARGEHQISVAVVAGGREITRSPAVVFYMKPPSVLSPVNQTAPRPTDQQPTGAVTAPPSTRSPGTPAAPRFGTNTGPAGP